MPNWQRKPGTCIPAIEAARWLWSQLSGAERSRVWSKPQVSCSPAQASLSVNNSSQGAGLFVFTYFKLLCSVLEDMPDLFTFVCPKFNDDDDDWFIDSVLPNQKFWIMQSHMALSYLLFGYIQVKHFRRCVHCGKILIGKWEGFKGNVTGNRERQHWKIIDDDMTNELTNVASLSWHSKPPVYKRTRGVCFLRPLIQSKPSFWSLRSWKLSQPMTAATGTQIGNWDGTVKSHKSDNDNSMNDINDSWSFMILQWLWLWLWLSDYDYNYSYCLILSLLVTVSMNAAEDKANMSSYIMSGALFITSILFWGSPAEPGASLVKR